MSTEPHPLESRDGEHGARSSPDSLEDLGDPRIAIYVYRRTTLAIDCAAPVRLSVFPGRTPDIHFDAGTHSLAVEPGVYLAHAGPRTRITGDDLEAVGFARGRPARRTSRRLFQVLPGIRRRELARFLRRSLPVPPPQRVIRRILVVDEDPAATSRYERGFGPERTVLATSDPAAARELARSASCDLLIVELRIGNESGIDLARALKREQPGLVVALCSGYLSVPIAVAAVRAGIDVVLFKPVAARDILRRIGADADEPGPDTEPAPAPDADTLESAEREHIFRILADCRGNISLAAARLGIYRSSLQRWLRKAGRPHAAGSPGAPASG